MKQKSRHSPAALLFAGAVLSAVRMHGPLSQLSSYQRQEGRILAYPAGRCAQGSIVHAAGYPVASPGRICGRVVWATGAAPPLVFCIDHYARRCIVEAVVSVVVNIATR